MADIDDILQRLGKKTRDRFRAASEITVERIPLASSGLTHGLNGGLGLGRQTVVYGNKSAGKSSIMLQSIGLAQRQGKTCAWIDSENSFDPEWARALGVDTSQLIVSGAKAINDFASIGVELMKAGVDVLVADSISAMIPSTYFEKEDELKDGLEGTKQIGTASKELGIAVNKLNYANEKTSLVLISQVRNQFHTYGAALKPMGGQAVMFFSSTVIKLWSNAAEREQIMKEIPVGEKLIQRPVGRPVNWTIEYNKIGPPGGTGSYDFYYGGPRLGIDVIGEALDLAELNGVVSRGGAWYTVFGERLQGRQRAIDWLKADETRVEKLLGELDGLGKLRTEEDSEEFASVTN